MSNPHMTIFGLGGSTIDILTLVEDYPSEEGVFYPKAISLQGGGPVSTALVAAARLGCSTSMIDHLGDDWVGQQILDEFQREGVGTQYIQTSAGHHSCVSNVLVRESDGTRIILHKKGDVPDLTPAQLPLKALAQASFLHLNGHHPQACLAAAVFCHDNNIPVSFDGGEYAGKRPVMKDLLPLTSICIVARQFALDFTEETDIQSAGEALYKLGPAVVGITDGIHGSWFWTTQGSFHQPAFKMPSVVDTTGCGDSFHGAFLAACWHGKPIREAARWSAATAALKTRLLGGRAALPGQDTLNAFLSSAEED